MSLAAFILSLSGTTEGEVPGGGGEPDYHTPLVDATVIDDGYYNRGPVPAQLSNGMLVSIYVKAGSHVDAGPICISRSTNGGASWTEAQISIGGTPLTGTAVTAGFLSTDRILICYNPDDTYNSIHFAYSDVATGAFTSAGSFTPGYTLSMNNDPMIILPSGKILCNYYKNDGTQVGFYQSTNSGTSWELGPSIFTGHASSGYGDGKGNEIAACIVEHTGSDATTKLIAFIRHDSVEQFMHYKSTDGGTTWTTDTTTFDDPGGYGRHYLYKFGTSSALRPVNILLQDGTVYVICGNRAGASQKLQIIYTTVANALLNVHHDWSDPVDLLTFNATTLGSLIDSGYPVLFEDYQGRLFCHYYDVSTETLDTGITTDRCWIKQFEILLV